MSFLLFFGGSSVSAPLTSTVRPAINVVLDPQRRGDPFDYSSSLAGGYLSSMIEEMWFTLRLRVPSSTVESDTDAVAQGKLSTGEITFSDTTNFRVLLLSTQDWPARTLFWDCQVRVAGRPYTVASGTLPMLPDITRAR